MNTDTLKPDASRVSAFFAGARQALAGFAVHRPSGPGERSRFFLCLVLAFALTAFFPSPWGTWHEVWSFGGICPSGDDFPVGAGVLLFWKGVQMDKAGCLVRGLAIICLHGSLTFLFAQLMCHPLRSEGAARASRGFSLRARGSVSRGGALA